MVKRGTVFYLTILLIALTCPSAIAQARLAAQASASAQRTQEDAEQRKRDEEAVRNMPDYGSDLAVVTSLQATIYEEARASSRALMQVKRNNFLALVEREPVGPWYRVVEVETATEGWIHERDVIIKLTSETSSGPPITEEKSGTGKDPEVVITNQEKDTDLNLRLNGQLYIITADSTRTLTLNPGVFKYYGYSPGIRPAFGSRTFQQGYKYTWEFKIVRR